MSYQVIARKYRPQKFADVVGQEHVTQTLSNAIEQNRIAHAYIFVGPRGTGKTTIARIFAKCLNCTGGPKVEFAENDPRCQEIVEGRSMDVLEIDGASNRGIEEIRELRETVKYVPATSKFKIYIIDEVHMLTKEAFNALLKTLEEPPPHVKFMFATTEPEKVLPTILSRCQRFDLRRIPSALIVKHLREIAQKESVNISDTALHAVARGADGGMRDAESTLDQLISFCGNTIEEADVLSMFGLTAQSQIIAMADAILDGAVEAALREFDGLAKQGKDLGRLISDLLGYFRNLLLFQVSKGDTRLIEASEFEASTYSVNSQKITGEALTRVMEVFSDCEARFRDAASKKILIELAIVKAIQARNAVSIDEVLNRLQSLRSGAPSSPVPTAQTAVRPATPSPSPQVSRSEPIRETYEPAPPINAAPVVSADLDAVWQRLLESLNSHGFLRAYIVEASPISLEKNILTIGFNPEMGDQLPMIDTKKNHDLLATKMADLGQPGVKTKFVLLDKPVHRASPSPAPQPEPSRPAPVSAAVPRKQEPAKIEKPPEPASYNKDEFLNDPLIKKALEIFKGQIVEIRPQ